MLKKILICIFGFLFFVNELYAIDLFRDDFDIRDDSKWTYLDNGGNIYFEDSVMNLDSDVMNFPYITNSEINKVRDMEEVIINFKFNYKYTDYMGNGIGVGYTEPGGNPQYQFSFWNDLTSGPVIQYRDEVKLPDGSCEYKTGQKKISIPGGISDNSWHVFSVLKSDGVYKVFLDSNLLFSSLKDQCDPSNIFIGNPLSGGRTWWSELSIDYVNVSVPEIPRNKIVIIPGLGASWNNGAILHDNFALDSEWSMTPFVKDYDLLISALEQNGLVKNQDFFVWNYDWRKPLSEIVFDLDDYLNNLGINDDNNVDLIGHSLGGLTARLWGQDNPHSVGVIITLGSPHYGSVSAYDAWNGAKFGDGFGFESVAINILLQLKKKNNTILETVRTFAPIVFDLFPTFDFLQKNGQVVSSEKSEYLSSKNMFTNTISSKLLTVDGIGNDTKEWINLGSRSMFDTVLGIWKDGRPKSYMYDLGDGTVLKESALISGAETAEFISTHRNLVDESTNLIVSKLGLGTTVVVQDKNVSSVVVFFLGSPADMIVNCEGINKSDDNGWVFFENVGMENCQVSLVGKDGGGVYHLVFGDGESWNYVEDVIEDGETINLLAVENQVNWRILINDFSSLGATEAKLSAIDHNIYRTIDEYILFRQKNHNFDFGDEIIEKLRILLEMEDPLKDDKSDFYNLALRSRSVVDTTERLLAKKSISPGYFAAITYEQANNLMRHGRDYAANYLAYRLFEIVWK
ncbi:hypothetical protein KKD37_03275 [Patescibacteria group bacterium]|nr:hypothetical protein [Patescibacteria group bacterium]